MKWRDNMINIHEKGIVGNCPYCKSSDTDYIFWENGNERGSLNIWCNSCNERIHVDCGNIPQNRKRMKLDEALVTKHEKSA